MIRISLGNVGSGKTVSEVREMFINKMHRTTYTNIKTRIKHCKLLQADMIIHKEQVGTTKKRDGSVEPINELKLNVDFWKEMKEPVNVVLDEAHSIVNSRRSMSKTNIIVTDWLALIRRVLGQTESKKGELVFITQLDKRIDIIAREMAHQVRYHVCHFVKTCKRCGCSWQENSDMPEGLTECPMCQEYRILKHSHQVEVRKFSSIERFESWKMFGNKSHYDRYIISDISDYFSLYNTLQWDNLFGEYY